MRRFDPQVFPRAGAGVVLLVTTAVLFSWPGLATVTRSETSWWMTGALLLMPLVVLALLWWVEPAHGTIRVVALVGALAALAALARIVSVGVGGLEWVFIVVILAGRVLGARWGFVVGALSIAVSSLVWGGVGPWTSFQMAAVGAVAAGAGLLPHGRSTGVLHRGERMMLAGYGILASYLFGLVMNLWFWPIAVGPETSLSFDPSLPWSDQLGRFLLYSLTTSTLTWDSVRAVVTATGILLVGGPVLRALRRVHSRVPGPGPLPVVAEA